MILSQGETELKIAVAQAVAVKMVKVTLALIAVFAKTARNARSLLWLLNRIKVRFNLAVKSIKLANLIVNH